jgi:hypothetical protein
MQEESFASSASKVIISDLKKNLLIIISSSNHGKCCKIRQVSSWNSACHTTDCMKQIETAVAENAGA